MIIRPSEIHEEPDRARLGVGRAAETLGVECDLRLASMWRVKLGDEDRQAFLEIAREEAQRV